MDWTRCTPVLLAVACGPSARDDPPWPGLELAYVATSDDGRSRHVRLSDATGSEGVEHDEERVRLPAEAATPSVRDGR